MGGLEITKSLPQSVPSLQCVPSYVFGYSWYFSQSACICPMYPCTSTQSNNLWHLCIYLPIYLPIYIHPSIYPSIYPSVSISPSIHLSIHPSIHPSMYICIYIYMIHEICGSLKKTKLNRMTLYLHVANVATCASFSHCAWLRHFNLHLTNSQLLTKPKHNLKRMFPQFVAVRKANLDSPAEAKD